MAPRIGVAYDILGNGKWKVFGSYGRFFDRFKYELPRGSFGGEVQDIYDFLVSNPNIFQYTRDGVIANHIRFQDQRTPANLISDNRIDPDLKPFQQAELTIGTAYDFGKGFIIEGRYTHKNIIRAIDDIGFPAGLAHGWRILWREMKSEKKAGDLSPAAAREKRMARPRRSRATH